LSAQQRLSPKFQPPNKLGSSIGAGFHNFYFLFFKTLLNEKPLFTTKHYLKMGHREQKDVDLTAAYMLK